ncbi:cytochrome-c peroxidase [Candidatus Methanoperedens nitratireducens]|uniref:Cytochrome c, 2 heme-binding sites n=1 Tax=Candidatus Methanoperedens nitratireducens TaxID=1392998 RepID=A0A284VMB0_9EURY|nr:cytochrome c peroxidase [Candidatus Methanoperedens nitroreducens]SNQ60382.1 Cytochrome c, 2 heme-binding sites [Candidatus Methanoperedens nitroreducens]
MLSKRILICAIVLLLAVVGTAAAVELTPKEMLGKNLFFDENLSEPKGQDCAVCHGSEAGWTGTDSNINAHGSVYEGAVQGRFGNRKPPSSAYATSSPIFHFEKGKGGFFIGGNFWDGRATGEKLGNPAADQAQGPFLNPLEQNNPDASAVVQKVCSSNYVDLFKQVWGDNACDNVSEAYDNIALSIAAYEASSEVNQFSSKYDYFLTGRAELTKQEKEGLLLFKGKAKCDKCHPSDGERSLFTDFTYDNLGTPRNPENPFYNMAEFNPLGAAFVDTGLGGFLSTQSDFLQLQKENYGKFKVPTLRNVDKRPTPDFIKAYSHNGYFKSLKEIVHFYNTRDVLPVCGFEGSREGVNCWPLPELALNMNTKELGNLGLTDEEEDDIVAFLKTLSDGFIPPE